MEIAVGLSLVIVALVVAAMLLFWRNSRKPEGSKSVPDSVVPQVVKGDEQIARERDDWKQWERELQDTD